MPTRKRNDRAPATAADCSGQVPFIGSFLNAGLFLIVATSPLSGFTATSFTFNLDSPAVFTSGVTCYLRMVYVATGDRQWVSGETLLGEPLFWFAPMPSRQQAAVNPSVALSTD